MAHLWLIEDNAAYRRATERALRDASNGNDVRAFANCEEALAGLQDGSRPDVVLLDVGLPGMDGIEGIGQIKQRSPDTSILVLTVFEDDDKIFRAICAGASGYLLKSDAQGHLIGAIECLALHKPFFTAKVSEALLDSFLKRPMREGSMLTNRERCVVQLIAEGHTNKQVASILNISLKTVETHRSAIMRKLNLSSSAGLVRYAIRNNIVQA